MPLPQVAGAIAVFYGDLTLTSCTFTSNSALSQEYVSVHE